MISGIQIARFRGINRSEIKDLSQVNLFFGKNNCGKSSLLEALFLVCGQSNPLLPVSLNAIQTVNRYPGAYSSNSARKLAICFLCSFVNKNGKILARYCIPRISSSNWRYSVFSEIFFGIKQIYSRNLLSANQ